VEHKSKECLKFARYFPEVYIGLPLFLPVFLNAALTSKKTTFKQKLPRKWSPDLAVKYLLYTSVFTIMAKIGKKKK